MAKTVKNDKKGSSFVIVAIPTSPGYYEAMYIDKRAYDGIRALGYKEGYAAGELEARRDAAEARLEAAALRLQLMHPEMLPPEIS